MSEPARPRLKVSREGMILIKSFEGFRPRAARGDDGRWVIGYGHTASAREGLTVGEQDAELLLQYDLLPVVKALNERVEAPLNQHQFDALASFAISVGVERFLASDVLQRLNSGRAGEAADALIGWPEPPSADNALRRRAAERALFFADPQSPVHLADLLAAPLPPPEIPAPTGSGPAEDAADEGTPAAEAPDAAPAPQAGATAPAWAPQERAFLPPRPTLVHQWFSPYAGVAPGPLPGFPSAAPPPGPPADPGPPAAEPSVAEAPAPESPASESPAPESAPPDSGTAETPEPFPAWPPAAGEAAPPPAPFPAAEDSAPIVPTFGEPLVLTPPAEAEAVHPGREPWPDAAPADPEAGELFDEPPSAPVLRHEAGVPSTRRFDWGETGAFMIMGAIGLAACAFSAAAFRKAMTDDSFIGDFTLIGWVLALIGLTCVGVSAWNLYRRWGRRD